MDEESVVVVSEIKSLLYLRLIGDRSIQEKDFGLIQIDRIEDMQKCIDNIKTVEDERISNHHSHNLNQFLYMTKQYAKF